MTERRTIARWTVRPDEDGLSLERFLASRVPSEPLDRVRDAMASRIRRTGKGPVRDGESIAILEEPIVEVPLDDPLPILATGEGWLAIDKPAGVPVHPVRSIRRNSVIERLRRQLGDRSLRLAHRLDRDTSGALIIARDAATASRLGRAFTRNAVRKEYVAIVRGLPATDSGHIDAPIGRAVDSAVRVRQTVTPNGRPASTDWVVEARGIDRSRVRLIPRTGRRHQLRVHLESIGLPILGDVLYGRPDRDYLDLVERSIDPRVLDGSPSRMLLHAARVTLDWPGLTIDVTCRIPRPFVVEP